MWGLSKSPSRLRLASHSDSPLVDASGEQGRGGELGLPAVSGFKGSTFNCAWPAAGGWCRLFRTNHKGCSLFLARDLQLWFQWLRPEMFAAVFLHWM